MTKNLFKKLADQLSKPRYPYLWEIALYSMLEESDKKGFVTFVQSGATSAPFAAICVPKYAAQKKSDQEIISLIKSLQKAEDKVCVVIAHANYNPADLQGVYVLDCPDGEEDQCFEKVLEHWKECSELYFVPMSTKSIDAMLSQKITSRV